MTINIIHQALPTLGKTWLVNTEPMKYIDTDLLCIAVAGQFDLSPAQAKAVARVTRFIRGESSRSIVTNLFWKANGDEVVHAYSMLPDDYLKRIRGSDRKSDFECYSDDELKGWAEYANTRPNVTLMRPDQNLVDVLVDPNK
jgi:hypothetical protein